MTILCIVLAAWMWSAALLMLTVGDWLTAAVFVANALTMALLAVNSARLNRANASLDAGIVGLRAANEIAQSITEAGKRARGARP